MPIFYCHYMFLVLLLFPFTNFSCFSVWQKLEEENREFFQAYYLRLTVKQQIMEFNKLLEQQVRLMRQIHPTGVVSVSNSNGLRLPPSKTVFFLVGYFDFTFVFNCMGMP